MGERAGDPGYEARQRIDAAIRALREVEDYARIESPWREGPHHTALADRARELHEAATEDLLNGSLKRPSRGERLNALEAFVAPEGEEAREGLRETLDRAGLLAANPIRKDEDVFDRLEAIHNLIQHARAALSDSTPPERCTMCGSDDPEKRKVGYFTELPVMNRCSDSFHAGESRQEEPE